MRNQEKTSNFSSQNLQALTRNFRDMSSYFSPILADMVASMTFVQVAMMFELLTSDIDIFKVAALLERHKVSDPI